MLIGLLSDPHSNLPALEAVLDDVGRVTPDTLVCLGDFVGYGAQPNEVVAALKDRCEVCLAGNHDLAALGGLDLATFNQVAAAAVAWTAEHLHQETRAFLGALSSRGELAGMELAHASLRDPVREYVIDGYVAAKNFSYHPFLVAAVGHTHIPALYLLEDKRVVDRRPAAGSPAATGGARVLMNPGAVGQPRDWDPRASWATWDTERLVFSLRRVEYPIEESRAAIMTAGLPQVLGDRLRSGW
ncbi:MAG: metallophosphoesterase family protein [Actinomycetota bacterium]